MTPDLWKSNLKDGSILCFSGRFLSSNIYLLIVDDRAVAVDCGMPWTANRVLKHLRRTGLKLEYIFLTHSHFDHVMGLNRLKRYSQPNVVAHTRNNRGDTKVSSGDIVRVIDNKLSFLAMYTGVHKDDHVWFYEKQDNLLFVGDHLPTQGKLEALRDRYGAKPKMILPGHGRPTPL